jgi:hypothetical protein
MLMTHENAQIARSGQLLELGSILVKNLPKDMPEEVALGWISNPASISRHLREWLVPPVDQVDTTDATQRQFEEWRALYREHGIEIELGEVAIPARRPGFDRLIVVAAGLKIQQVYDWCTKAFKTQKCTDQNLDEAVPTNDRGDPGVGAYAIWIRNEVEADKRFKNKSANNLKAANHVGMTLLERLLLELKYYKETGGKHLDIQNITLCTASRYSDGFVPYVLWHRNDSAVSVGWCNSGGRGGGLRSREVVAA